MVETTAKGINLPRLLKLSVNMLDSYFFRSAKEKSRKLFKEIEAGRPARLGTLTIGENPGHELQLILSLDIHHFDGLLTFHQFRIALSKMLREIDERLRRQADLRIYTGANRNDVLFFLPGVVEQKQRLNFLVLGLNAAEAGTIKVNLRFLDPSQFRQRQNASPEGGAAAQT